jgi:hypothetical protein
MGINNEQNVGLLNSSGFPLQLAVEQTIHSLKPDWELIREAPWHDRSTGQSGFVDLVAQYGMERIVVECKRPRGGRWLFVTAKDSQPQEGRVRLCWTYYGVVAKKTMAFEDMRLRPTSYESDICIVGGQAEDQKPMLERLSHSLLTSQLSLAREEMALAEHGLIYPTSVYIPVIITCAELLVSQIDPSSISLVDGTVSEPTFQSVELVRFRKSLLTAELELERSHDVSNRARGSEATVIVIHAASLPQILQDWGLRPKDRFGRFPWASLQGQ